MFTSKANALLRTKPIGNLAENLAQRDKPLDEREILILFHQTVSAIRHMHDHNILHRDLKTANILLTKEGIIKVGDFGISKMMSTRAKGANTVVGTPYYISPEMCEGKMYDEKSDVWALGCILYEMACLQKTFEGSNLPALVNKIMKGQFAPVKGNYSHGLKQLIRDLLQRDPEFRPTAGEIMHERLPELLAHFSGELGDEVDEEMMSAIENVKQREKCGSAVKNTRSVVYSIRTFESSISLNPIPLPPKSKVIQLAVSATHTIALTNELMVYTWGDGRRGQLGHGILETWRSRPECVAQLKGKSISRVCAGEGFSVFASNSGIIMTCGDGTAGCLGHGDWNCASRPKLIETLLSVDVSAIACGPSHVVVVGGEGEVYSWGRGISGRLGLGQEDDCCIPTQVTVPNEVNIRNVKCGKDNTMFITDNGSVLACGNNQYNKLGLNEHSGFFRNLFMKTDVDKVSTPAPIKSLSGFHVVDISMGPNHTAVLVEPGHVITFGRNSEGQLGRGHTRSSNGPSVVKSMVDKTTLMLECGETFTIVGTIENALYFWGTRYVMCAPTRPPTQDTKRAFTASNDLPNAVFNQELDNMNYNLIHNSVQQRGESGFTLIKEEDDDEKSDAASSRGGSGSFNVAPSPRPLLDRRPSKSGLPSSTGPRMKDVLLNPQEILALYASPMQISKGETVNLSSIRCQGQNIFVVVDTTAPLPNHGRRRVRPPLTSRDGCEAESKSSPAPAVYEMKATSNEDSLKITQRPEPEGQSPSKELDTMGPVPNWLKEELENSDLPWPGGGDGAVKAAEAKEPKLTNVAEAVSVVTGHNSAEERSSNSAPHAANQTRTPHELKQELERLRRAKSAAENRLGRMDDEFRKKQQELEQQAEANAKERERALRAEIDRLHLELSKQTASYQDYNIQIEKVKDELHGQDPKLPSSRLCVIQ